MKKFGILAYPVHHSLSPQMHNSAIVFTGANAVYTRYGVAPRILKQFLFENFRKERKISGLSVSVPHKETCQKFLDSLDSAAEKIGAVNTIYWEGEKLCGTNTDCIGFAKSLLEKYSPAGKKVLVLGAGGATKAILFALENMGEDAPSQVFLWNRTRAKAEKLLENFPEISLIDNPSEISDEVDLVINTTSLGMEGEWEDRSPVSRNFWKNHHTAFDIVYTPLETVFLKNCREAGGTGISGEKMLLFQGIAQFELFTGKTVTPEVEKIMQKALNPLPEFSEWKPPVLSNDEKKNILGTIVAHKKSEIYTGFEFWEQKLAKSDFAFSQMLFSQKKNGAPHLIAEVKPASPSKGKIFKTDDSPEKIAQMYEKNGASCLSVLTDWKFFGATIQNLKKVREAVYLPLLRKDFIIHPAQIFEARFYGADAVLLMKSVLSTSEIQKFLDICQKLGMDALVEVHDTQEFEAVMTETSAKIIGVNSRDLKTLTIDPQNFQKILDFGHQNFPEKMEGKVFVAESGINSPADISEYFSQANAVLVGTGILLEKDESARIQKIQALAGK